MTALLTDEEWSVLAAISEHDLVEMAVDLDVLVDAQIDARALTEQCLLLVLDRAKQEGLPLSKYDREDLVALPAAHRAAIARLQGLPSDASVDKILKAGGKVYRQYRKTRPEDAVALMLPMLLPALARVASELNRP